MRHSTRRVTAKSGRHRLARTYVLLVDLPTSMIGLLFNLSLNFARVSLAVVVIYYQ